MSRLPLVHALLLLAAAASLAAAARMAPAIADDPQPRAKWHRRFTVDFNETEKFGPLFHWETDGTWYYDADAPGGVAEAVYRANGRGDRYCKSIHAMTSTPCLHIVANGSRYIKFPELRECCKCCDSSKGCGGLSPAWLDDAEYQGLQEMFGWVARLRRA